MKDLTEFTQSRLNYLKKHGPTCVCGESRQIQLREFIQPPAEWKCRTCKKKWNFEPDGTPTIEEFDKE